MLELCSSAFDPGEDRTIHMESDKVVPMDEKIREIVVNTSKKLNEEGLRVLLVAIREFDGTHPLNYTVEDEN